MRPKKIKKTKVRAPTKESSQSVQDDQCVFTPSDDGCVSTPPVVSPSEPPLPLEMKAKLKIIEDSTGFQPADQLSESMFSTDSEMDDIVNGMIDANECMDQSAPAHSPSHSSSKNDSPLARGKSILSTPSPSSYFREQVTTTQLLGQGKTLSFPEWNVTDDTGSVVQASPANGNTTMGMLNTGGADSSVNKNNNKNNGRICNMIHMNEVVDISADSRQLEREVSGQASAARSDIDVLYKKFLKGKSSDDAVDDWMAGYMNDKKKAILRLKNLILRSSGCLVSITSDMESTMTCDTILQKLSDDFVVEKEGTYPLVDSCPELKNFCRNFGDFLNTIVKQSQESIMLDQLFSDQTLAFLVELSKSQIRALRHTSTFAALKLMTAVVEMTARLSVDLETAREEFESTKNKGNRALSARIESIQRRLSTLQANFDEHVAIMDFILKSVFKKRYFDIAMDIRSICFQEIGIWMNLFSQHFVCDDYLKYIGWTLYDQEASIRVLCLKAIISVYNSNDSEIGNKLKTFTDKYKARIVQLTVSEESEVAVEAVNVIKAMHSLYRNDNSLLSDHSYNVLFTLLFNTRRSIALAVGEFLVQKYFAVDENESFEWPSGRHGSPHTKAFRELVNFFIEADLPEHSACVIDSLIEIHPMLSDWACMTDLLMEEPRASEEALSGEQEEALTKLMVAAIRQCTTGETPPGRMPAKRAPSSGKGMKLLKANKRQISEHFIPLLPALLKKFLNAPTSLSSLLAIPFYFDLGVYTTSRHKKYLQNLFQVVEEILEKSVDENVVQIAAKAMECICCDLKLDESTTKGEQSRILEFIWKNAQAALEKTEEASQVEDDEVDSNLVANLRRIAISSAHHDFEKCDVWSSVFRIIRKTITGRRNFPAKAVKYAITTCFYSLLWNLKTVKEIVEERASATKEISELSRRLEEYMRAMKYILLRNSSVEAYAEDAFISVCDLLPVFSDQLENEQPLELLVYKLDEELLSSLSLFLAENVFLHEADDDIEVEETGLTKMDKKRSMVAQYSKLLGLNIIPVTAADVLIRFYSEYYKSFGDIIKVAFCKAMNSDEQKLSVTILECLQDLFKGLSQEDVQYDKHLHELKELARKLVFIFGPHVTKNRAVMDRLHREGIKFSLLTLDEDEMLGAASNGIPRNLDFLDILREFSWKLPNSNKVEMLQFLTENLNALSQSPDVNAEKWLPFIQYRNSLDGNTQSYKAPLKSSTSTESSKKKQGRKGTKNPKAARGLKRKAATPTS